MVPITQVTLVGFLAVSLLVASERKTKPFISNEDVSDDGAFTAAVLEEFSSDESLSLLQKGAEFIRSPVPSVDFSDHLVEPVWGEIAGDLFEPGCIIAATIVLSMALWRSSLQDSAKTAKQAPEKVMGDVPEDSSTLGWLAALVVTSLLLLILQLTLGFATGALTLIADSAHTAADTVSYAFSWFVERAKRSAGMAESEKAKRDAARFDAVSAVFSVLIVLGTSVCATFDAVRRLRRGANEGAALAKQDPGLIGPALLCFAILSTAANCGLLVLHRRRALAATSHRATEPSTAPPPLELDEEPELEDELFMCSPCLPAAATPAQIPVQVERSSGSTQKSQEKSARRTAQIAWLHQAFHPSCKDADCAAPKTGDGSAAEASMDDSADTDEKSNLNLYGAVLHLLTDVLRSLVILVVGMLVQIGFISDAASADAICAIIVSICILVGSLALLRSAAAALCPRRAQLSC